MTARSPQGPIGNHVQKTSHRNRQLAKVKVRGKTESRVAWLLDPNTDRMTCRQLQLRRHSRRGVRAQMHGQTAGAAPR
jgi:hypothetical protein